MSTSTPTQPTGGRLRTPVGSTPGVGFNGQLPDTDKWTAIAQRLSVDAEITKDTNRGLNKLLEFNQYLTPGSSCIQN